MAELAHLSLLLHAPSKDFVTELFQTSFTCGEAAVPPTINAKCAEAMDITVEQSMQMFSSIGALIKKVVFNSVSSKEELLAIIPVILHDKLKKLIASVFGANLKTWRAQAANSQLSLPQLKEFDWRIDIKTSADTVTRMSVPTALVQMKIQDLPTSVNEMATLQSVTFEVTKDTIETMLDGMGKILEQMDSIN